ncbi:MAG: YfgM family protein [Leptothrix sp. (in: b-proteobacteria)]
MATHLDLEEQEQLDQFKHFWNQYGNLLTWALVLVLAAYAGWNGWHWWQRDQAAKAGGMYGELDRVAQAGDADRASKIFADLKDRYAGTAFAEQAGLLAAKAQFEKGQQDAAQASLSWVSEHATEDEYRVIARLRLAALLSEQKKYDQALAQLAGDVPKQFVALVADRRGDVLQAQGKRAEAIAAYQQAWKSMAETVDYRRLVEAKLIALGVAPEADAAAGADAAASGASK